MSIIARFWVWVLTAAAIVFAGVGIFSHNQLRDKRKLEATNKILVVENGRLSAELATLQEDYKNSRQAYDNLAAARLQISAKARAAIKRIKSNKKSDDAPPAAALKKALEAL